MWIFNTLNADDRHMYIVRRLHIHSDLSESVTANIQISQFFSEKEEIEEVRKMSAVDTEMKDWVKC